MFLFRQHKFRRTTAFLVLATKAFLTKHRKLIALTASTMAFVAAVRSPFVREIESVRVQNLAPAANLQRERVRFEATRKAFNMSASYPTSSRSRAREHIQNWWDQCRVMVADRQPSIHCLDSAVLAAIAQRNELLANAKAYAACGRGRLLGILLECTDRTGQQLLFLKNYGAQITLDNLML